MWRFPGASVNVCGPWCSVRGVVIHREAGVSVLPQLCDRVLIQPLRVPVSSPYSEGPKNRQKHRPKDSKK